jgi:hypothetical protein
MSANTATCADPTTRAIAYLEAVGESRLDVVADMLHEDITFEMPGKTIVGAESYLAALKKLGPIVVRNDIKNVVTEGDRVCIWYDFITDTAVGAVPSVELVTFEGARIRKAQLVFHSAPWPAVIAELQRRTQA